MVLTLVPVTRMPWITSGLAKRRVTARSAGTTTQLRHEGELGGDDPRRHLAVGLDPGAEIGFGELAGQVERLGVDVLAVAAAG